MNNFWETKTLSQMNAQEWELLCDGCGQCCLHKLEDEDTGDIYMTRVACKLLDLKTCRCTQYKKRTQFVPDCMNLQDVDFHQYHWLPKTCAYRLLHEKKPLPIWHPLISGQKDSVEKAGFAVSKFAICETNVPDLDDLEDYILE
jgi:uncharacterized cysteine cluster protein YcgN (CxxCxxCC family)